MAAPWRPWPERDGSTGTIGRHPWHTRYAVAVILAAVGLLVRLPLHSLIHEKAPYITFFLATLASAAFGGFGPGIVTTVIGTILAGRFVTAGTGLFGLIDPSDPSGALRFVILGIVTSYVCGLLVTSNERARFAQFSERRQRLLFQQTLVGIADAVISTDTVSRIQLMNAAAERLSGCRSDEAFGKLMERVLKLEGVHPAALVDQVVRSGSVIALPPESTIHNLNQVRHIEGRGSPVTDDKGRIVGVVVTFRDITERKEAETFLQEQAEELRRSNRELEEFAYVVSHDLQEPLRMVNTYSELLLRKISPQSNPQYERLAAVIREGIERMNHLIHDLLEYSRVSHDKGNATLIDPQSSVDEALSACRPLISEAGADVIVGHLPAVQISQSQLTQVFQNLVSNAIKYRKSGAHPHIRIAAREEQGEVLFSVADDGIGFDPTYASKIFGLFKRLHTNEYPGTGVGLAITKKIVERYHGRIWAESSPGDGATFWFTLPASTGENKSKREAAG